MRANRLERGDSVDRTIRNLIQQSAQYIGNHHSSTYDMAASNTPGSSSSMTSDFKITLEDRTSSGIGSMADSDIEGEEEEEGEAEAVVVQVTDKGSNNANLENNLQAAGDNNNQLGVSPTESNTSTTSDSSSTGSNPLKVRHFSFGAISNLQSLAASASRNSTNDDAKKVRFADSLGLDLVKVKLFDEADDYKLPISAPVISTNSFGASSSYSTMPEFNYQKKTIVPLFDQPGSFPKFMDLVRHNKVVLENAFLEQGLTIKGIVRVLNMDYHKAVYIRWTMDEWRNMMDYRASYLSGSNDGFSDKFQFKIYAPLDIGQTLVFAVRYHCVGEQFWDNNNGKNYKFLCKGVSEEKKEEEQLEDFGLQFS